MNDYKNDPIFKQAFPSPAELIVENYELADPLAEDKDSPCDCITHRYPDRVLFLVSNTCAMYCRHCTRKRKVGDVDSIPDRAKILEGIDYIRKNPQIRDVLLSGGDPFMLSDGYLDWILTEIRAIPHVEVIRIGTRVPVVLPFRVTDDLVAVLKKHHPLWVNMQFNHPKEMTDSARTAVAKLADAGIPLGNQSVLLAGINDCPRIMKELDPPAREKPHPPVLPLPVRSLGRHQPFPHADIQRHRDHGEPDRAHERVCGSAVRG